MLKKEYPSIYFLKGICSVLVVLIHTQFFFHNLYVPVYRLAVPLFFMISGFFLVDEMGNLKIANIDKAVKKMLNINLITSVIYIIYSYIRILYLNEEVNLKVLFPDNFILKLFLGHPYCGVLWYVTAYTEILLILKLFYHFHKERILLYLIPVFILLELFFGKYSFLVDYEFNHFYHRNFITMGLPFVLMGIAIHKYRLEDYSCRYKTISVLFLILSYMEYFILQKYNLYREGDLVISSIFLAPTLFIVILQLRLISKKNIMTLIGKEYSLNIYLYHPMVLSMLYTLRLDNYIKNYEFLVVLIVTFVGCVLSKKLSMYYRKIVAAV